MPILHHTQNDRITCCAYHDGDDAYYDKVLADSNRHLHVTDSPSLTTCTECIKALKETSKWN